MSIMGGDMTNITFCIVGFIMDVMGSCGRGGDCRLSCLVISMGIWIPLWIGTILLCGG